MYLIKGLTTRHDFRTYWTIYAYIKYREPTSLDHCFYYLVSSKPAARSVEAVIPPNHQLESVTHAPNSRAYPNFKFFRLNYTYTLPMSTLNLPRAWRSPCAEVANKCRFSSSLTTFGETTLHGDYQTITNSIWSLFQRKGHEHET